MRDLSEKTGSVARIAELYRRLSGREIDYKALRFHLVAFSAASSLLISDDLFNPSLETDYSEHFINYHGSLLIALEALANFLGLELADIDNPGPVETPDTLHLDMLVQMIDQIPDGDDAGRHRRDKIAAEVAFLKRRNAFGRAFDEAYLGDVEDLTGVRPVDVTEADTQLENFVHTATPAHDVSLLHLFYRQAQRQCFLADIPQNQRLHRFLRERIATVR